MLSVCEAKLREGAVENLRSSVAVTPYLSSQVAGRRGTKGEAPCFPHSLQKAGLILKKNKRALLSPLSLAAVHALLKYFRTVTGLELMPGVVAAEQWSEYF